MKNYATATGTIKYAGQYPQFKFNNLGTTGLLCSQLGFGSYRIHKSIDEQRSALEYALDNGINLIDTSSNYADGGSEELIGMVLKEMMANKKLQREQVIIVSKVGYLQGENYVLSQQLKRQNKPFPELVEYANGLEHCIHPDFIFDQLTRSLQRMQLETIDVYLLHNPEYYLMYAQKAGIPIKEALDEYYKRIEKALLHLEIEVQNGRIQYYGISSNTFPNDKERYDFTSLEKIWDIAETISNKHHFRVVQMPMNLMETGAVLIKNQTSDKSVLDFAIDKKLAVLINRPLNAFTNGQVWRLVSLVASTKEQVRPENELSQLAELEQQFAETILRQLDLEEEKQKELAGLFSTGGYLENNWTRLGPYWQWLESQAKYIAEQISYGVQLVNEASSKKADTINWLNSYVETFNKALDMLTIYFGQTAAQKNLELYHTFKAVDADWKTAANLHNLAIRALRTTTGVSCVLAGARKQEYVEGFLTELKTGLNLSERKVSWEKLAGLNSPG